MRNFTLAFLMIVMAFIVSGCGQPAPEQINENKQINESQQVNKSNCLQDDCLLVADLEYPVGDLSEEIIEALNLALEDEYKARTTYEKIIEKFGEIRPFIMIVRAEESHISSLKAVYDKYGIDIPENDWEDKIVATDTLQEACALGVVAEIENARLYREDLMPVVAEYPDIKSVFENLMNASEQKHLPAFQKCD